MVKWTLRGEALRPRACVLDPRLIRGLGFSDFVSGILDTFTHAVEAAWSIYSTETGDCYAAQAIQLVGEAVALLQGQPEVPDKVLSLAQDAGHNAGHAITFTPTTSCHAVSYVLTRRRGLRHGHACALALGRLLPFNEATTASNCADPRGAEHVRSVLREVYGLLAERAGSEPLELIAELLDLAQLDGLDGLNLPTEQIADEALTYSRIHDNPRTIDRDALTLALR